MRTADADHTILSIAARQGGAVTSAQLLAAGLDRHQVARREGRLFTRLSPGVYVIDRRSIETLAWAATLAVPGAALSHLTAGRRHDLPIRRDSEITVTVPTRTSRPIEGVRFVHSNWLPAVDVDRSDGPAITTVARTVCDLAALVPPQHLIHLLESAVVRGVDPADLRACIDAFRRRGRAGSRLLGEVGPDVLDTTPVTTSMLELRAVQTLRLAGLDGFVEQYRPPWYDGIRGIVDLAWPVEQVIVELDGRRWHTTTQAFDDDRRRDQRALRAGWWPIRVSWATVTRRPGEFVDLVRAALHDRRQARPA